MVSKYEWNQVGAGTMIGGMEPPTPWAPKLADCASSEEYDELYWAPGEPGSILRDEWEYVPPPIGYVWQWWNDETLRRFQAWVDKLWGDIAREEAAQ